MSLAYGTPVQTLDGPKPVEQIEVGDMVLASDDAGGWRPTEVAFSQGASGGRQENLLRVDWNDSYLLVTLDHPFELADGSIRAARNLTAGQKVRAADGSIVTLWGIMVGRFTGGIHAIGTATPWRAGSLAGRLLQTGGLVTGDFILQVNAPPPSLPSFGTREAEEEAEAQHLPTLRHDGDPV